MDRLTSLYLRLRHDLLPALRRDVEGASMVEYTILIGLITAAVIAAIVFVGGWVGTQWTNLQTTLGAAP